MKRMILTGSRWTTPTGKGIVLASVALLSRAFRLAFRSAHERVWLIDDYLLGDQKCAKQLEDMLFETSASDIRLITTGKGGAKEYADHFRSLEPDLQKRNPSGTPIRILISLNLRRQDLKDSLDVHDRFAIIDDVLWHCGATIGGLHHAINAMSFGWSAEETKAIGFFERLWKCLEEDDDR